MARRIRDRRTGRMRTVSVARSRKAKKAWNGRRNRPMKAAQKRAIRRAVKKTLKRGRTVFGRKVRKRK